MKSLAIESYRSWACHRGRRGRRRRRRKMDCLNLSDWNYPDTMLGIPINSTTLFLFLFSTRGLSLHVYPISLPTREPVRASLLQRYFIRNAEARESAGYLFLGFLMHAVSITRVNFNSLSDDPRSELLNMRRPLLVRRWISSESSLISMRTWSAHPFL